jgi:hypothetical protein
MKLSLATVTILLTTATLSAPTDYTPKGGWDSIDYPKGTGENLDKHPNGIDHKVSTFPFVFTSTYSVVAKGSEVRNGTVSVPGPKDAIGYFNYGINSKEDTICYVCLLPSPLQSVPKP